MNTTYIKNIPFAHGELSIVMSNHADEIRRHSCSLAGAIQKAGVGVLLINCGISDRRFREGAPKADVRLDMDEEGNPEVHFLNTSATSHLLIHSSVRGDLIDDMEDFNRLIHECGIGVIVLAGWEWSSDTWRKRERLLYRLRELMAVTDVSVIVYSMNPVMPVAGMLTRGSVGRLSTIAIAVTKLATSNVLEALVPKPPPLVTTAAEMEEAKESAQLLANEINGLQFTESDVLKPPVRSVKIRGAELKKNVKCKM